MAAAANDPGECGDSRAARWLLAPPSCGASLRLPLSLPGSFASLTMITWTDSWRSGSAPRGGGAPIPRQAEDALRDDVSLHLARAAGDRHRAVAEVLPRPAPARGRVRVVHEGRVGTQD